MSKKNATSSPSRVTYDELVALPENGGYDVVTDAKGRSTQKRRPLYFLANDSDVLFYTMTDGSRWRVGLGPDGKRYKQRFDV